MLTRSIFNQSNYFFYPKEGIGEIARKIQESILRNNGTIIHGAKVRDISMNDNRISHIAIDDLEGKRVSMGISLFVSTTPIDSFFEMLFGKNEATPNLKWRDVRIIYIYLDKILERENETFYFPGLDIRFGRVSDIRRYSPYLNTSLEGTLLTVEIACSKDDDTWKMSDEELLNLCLPDLIKVNIIKKEARVLRYFSLILEKAYPIYVIDWKEKFSQIYSKLNAIENLFTIGRRGLFLHCNIDHCIIQGLVLGDFIIKNKRRDKGLWNKEASSFFSFSARD
jgi:protoporphyrinogen oxidase